MNRNTAPSLIIFVIVAMLLAVFVVRPLFQGIKQESENLISQKRLFAELENKSESLKSFQMVRETHRANLEKIDKLFVDGEEPINLIEFLEKEAANFYLSIDIIPVSPKEVGSEPWPSISFRMEIEGSFPGFLRFLERLESSQYLLDISNLNLRRLAKESNGDITASFSMKAYTQ